MYLTCKISASCWWSLSLKSYWLGLPCFFPAARTLGKIEILVESDSTCNKEESKEKMGERSTQKVMADKK